MKYHKSLGTQNQIHLLVLSIEIYKKKQDTFNNDISEELFSMKRHIYDSE